MNIYPKKPVKTVENKNVQPVEAFNAVRAYALGHVNKSTCCAGLKVQGPQFDKYLQKYKDLVSTIHAEMVKNKDSADIDSLKSAISVEDPHGFKDKIVDDLIDRETAEGTLAAFKAKYVA